MELYRNEGNNLHRESGPAIVSKNLLQWIQNGKLHRVDGPAVMTPNGTRKYYWKGTPIPTCLWLTKDSMKASEILSITNIEVRRSVIEMIGYENFIKKAGSALKVIHEDNKTGAILYRIDMPQTENGVADEPVVVVRVLDGTPVINEEGVAVRKQYFIRVPPDVMTCAQAIAWTFEMDPDEYAELEQET